MLVKIAKIVYKIQKAWMYAHCAAYNGHDKKDLCSGTYASTSKCKSCPYSKTNEKNKESL